MPVFVTCPACGCRVQMAEGVVGQHVRCIACNDRFVADLNVKPPPPPPRRLPRTAPLPGEMPSPLPPRADEEDQAHDGRPFCPGCGRRVNWDWIVCYHCGEPFDYTEDGIRRRGPGLPRPRRDSLRHRGRMLVDLGNLTMAVGALSLCIGGLGLLLTVPVGIATIVMATTDLNLMRSGQMDPNGRLQTESGRTAAITGLVLSLVFAACWVLLYFSRV